MRRRIAGTYGIDAPMVPLLSTIGAIALYLIAWLQTGFAFWFTLIWAVLLTLQVVLYLHTTLRGKFVIWRRLLSTCPVPANARVLDVGCGRGLVLITAMAQFTTATGVGVDLWRSRDQSGNDPETTWQNARENGVADRIELQTQDMTQMDLPDASFDLVTANVAIQNVKDRQLRRQTIEHIFRVTKPGGMIHIVDIQYMAQYRDDLLGLGAIDVELKHLGPIGWFGNPFFASRLVTARKPR